MVFLLHTFRKENLHFVRMVVLLLREQHFRGRHISVLRNLLDLSLQVFLEKGVLVIHSFGI